MIYFVKFWEVFLKSKKTKKRFLKIFINNLKKRWIHDFQVKWSYLIVRTNENVDVLKNNFWVYKVEKIRYLIDDFSDKNLDKLKEKIDFIVKENEFSNFRISVKREDKTFFLDSLEIQRQLWKYVCEKHWKTPSYKDYEFKINIRILKNEIWLRTSNDSYTWLWWLPYGSEWNALMLFSGWIDSPVASFLAWKRWIKQDFLFLNVAWSELLLSQVFESYLYLKQMYWINWRFFSLDISHIINNIKQNIPSWYRQIILKMFLYKFSEKACNKLKKDAIVSWENLWQVSTQTLWNLNFLDSVSDFFHVRPLFCFDKTEIMDFAKKIWTYKISSCLFETCNIENHSNSNVKDKNRLLKIFNELNIDFERLIYDTKLVKNTIKQEEVYKFKVNNIVWELIDVEKNKKIPKLEIGKKYTFFCFSWYKSSSRALKMRKKWYETYFLLK